MPTIVNAAPGFEPTLPGTGKVIIPVGTSDDVAYAITLQADGKLLVAGYSKNGTSYDFSLSRLNANGSLDTSFDGDGKAIIPVGTAEDWGQAMTLQPDGKILVAGYSMNGSSTDFSLIRLNANGSLDTSFDGDGKAIIPVATGYDEGRAIKLQADGKILVAGYSNSDSGSDFSLIRLNANGSLDTSFDGDGKAIVPVGTGNDYGQAITLQADGKILVAGYSNSDSGSDFSLIRLNANGSLDTSFDGDGKTIIPVGTAEDWGQAMTLQPDGKILVAGYSMNGSSTDFSLIRLNANGSPDSGFDGDGKVIVSVGTSDDVAYAITLQADGKILVAGYSKNGTSYDFSLIRLNANGSLDTSFDGDGKAIIPVGVSWDFGSAIELQGDGKILMAGVSSNGSNDDFSLIRLNAGGSLDMALGSTPGINTLGGAVSYTENASAIALDLTVAIYDPELTALNNGLGNYSGASVNLARSTGANAQDVFGASGSLSFAGGNAVLSGATIGSFTNTGGTLAITFNSNATQARVNQALSSLTYANSSDAPPASVQISWTFSDGNSGAQGTGGALAASGSTTVNITAVNDAPTGSVSITGTATQANTLTASNTLADLDGMGVVSYQWKAGGVNISGATASSYTLAQSEVGKAITVVASYQDGGNTVERVSSSATSSVMPDITTPTVQWSDTTPGVARGVTQWRAVFSEAIESLSASSLGVEGGTLSDLVKVSASEYTFKVTPTSNTAGVVKVSLAQGAVKDLAGNVNAFSSSESQFFVTRSAVLPNQIDLLTGLYSSVNWSLYSPVSYGGSTYYAAAPSGSAWVTQGSVITSDTVGAYVLTMPSLSELGNVFRYGSGSTWKTGYYWSSTWSSAKNNYQAMYLDTGGWNPSYVFGTGYTYDERIDAQQVFKVSVNNTVAGFLSTNVVSEQDPTGSALTLVRTGITSSSLSVKLKFSGAAVLGSDFSLAGDVQVSNGVATAVFAAGKETASIRIFGLRDALSESDEALVLNIDNTSLEYASAFPALTVTVQEAGPVGNVQIIGTPTQGNLLTASHQLTDPQGIPSSGDGAISYQWKASGSNIVGATASSYTLTQAEVGKLITVVVSYTDLEGMVESVSSAATAAVANVNDAPTGNVNITGTTTQGQTLTASNTLADVDGLGTVSYQWKSGGANISGATGSTYTLTQAEVGKAITVVASYKDVGNTAETVSSSATSSVMNANDAPTGGVSITGTATQGQTLTASNSLADLDGMGLVSYQWKAGGTNISGATGSSYMLTQSEVGNAITVVASYTDSGNTAESVNSSATSSVVNANDAPTGSVSITGTTTQGQTLTASNSLADVDGLGTVNYQWKSGGVNISGATGSTYTLKQSEVGKAITVVASYTDVGNTAESVSSSATSSVVNVNDAPTGGVRITGTTTQGQTLTASNTLADVDGLGAISYQWKAGGANISSATGSTYTLTQSEVGKTITVVASYTDIGNTAESVSSSATSSVVNLNDAPTGSVSITGTATQGQTLTASNTLADVDGLGAISYQWKAGGANISGATGSTYTLTQSEVGKALTVVASYADSGNTTESVSSSATSSVVNVNDAPTGGVSITGTATQGQTLTASNSLADLDGMGLVSYQWKAGGTNISGATGSTYMLTQSEVGKAITVVASYTDSGNTAESVSSSATSSVVNANDAPTGSVSITGTATQGQTLTASNTLADVDGLGAISYQWKAGGSNISGATNSTYTLTQSEVGKAITVVASYTDSGNTAESVSSSATSSVANVNDAPTGSVTISGTAAQGQTLTASNTLADADGIPASGAGVISYQWNADGVGIFGAKGLNYTLTQGQIGKVISVTANYTDLHGTAETVTSASTSAVAGVVGRVNNVPTGSVTISGTAKVGQTLTASNSLADADGVGVVSYQWFAAGTAISGATGSSLVLASAQQGKAITLKASYTDGQQTVESMTSSATAAVAAPNSAIIDIGNLGGHVYEWKSHALLSDVGVKLKQTSSVGSTVTPLFELKGLALNAQGDASAELWVNFKEASGSLDLTMQFDKAITGSFVENTGALPTGWSLIPGGDAGSLTLGGMGLTDASGSVKLGVVNFDLPTGVSAAQIKLVDGSTGASSLTPYAVSVGGSGLNATTGADGKYGFELLDAGSYQLDVSKALTTAETGSVINSADALAALKIAVGRNPNADPDGAGPQQAPAVSPYQFIAADANQDGKITSADALAILKMAVKRTDAPAKEWLFVNENQDFWNEATSSFTTTKASVLWDKVLQVSSPLTTQQNVVAVLKGDVNGSWAPPTGAQDLDITTPTYFTDLAAKLGTQVNQWAVIG